MPAKVTTSQFSKRIGAKIVDAHKQYKDAPVDLGNSRLPPGIRNGVAQLESISFGIYKPDAKGGLANAVYCIASGSVFKPTHHEGAEITGMFTRIQIPFCDTPSRKSAPTFAHHWDEYINLFKQFNVDMPPELLPGESKEQAADRIWAFLENAGKELVKQKPFFMFSTREWTPAPTPQYPKPTPMVFEEWKGKIDYDPGIEAGGGVSDSGTPAPQTQTQMNPEPFNEFPPAGGPPSPPVTTATSAPGPEEDLAAIVTALIEVASVDPNAETATPEGKDAMNRLEKMALERGVPSAQIQAAPDWAALGDMILAADGTAGAETPPADPVKGGVYIYRRRTATGAIALDKNKNAFAPLQVEVLTTDTTTRTATVKGPDGKALLGGDKHPLPIKWEYLEAA